jgi:hypothetical protein
MAKVNVLIKQINKKNVANDKKAVFKIPLAPKKPPAPVATGEDDAPIVKITDVVANTADVFAEGTVSDQTVDTVNCTLTNIQTNQTSSQDAPVDKPNLSWSVDFGQQPVGCYTLTAKVTTPDGTSSDQVDIQVGTPEVPCAFPLQGH